MSLELVEPGLNVGDRLALETKHACPRVVSHPLVGDEARLEQDPQVPAHHRCGRLGGGGELARTARPVAQQLQHPAARRVGENREQIINHRRNN
jgi:hypothetical protein